MKKRIRYYLPLSFLLVVASSCGKKTGPDTPYTKVQGNWKLEQEGTDDNGDGIVESYEIHPVVTGEDNEFTYRDDGTGLETYSFNGLKDANSNFNWGIINADSLRLNYSAHDTVTYYLLNVTATDMSVLWYTQPTLVYMYFVKK